MSPEITNEWRRFCVNTKHDNNSNYHFIDLNTPNDGTGVLYSRP
jgi:hypothetical protein